MEIFANAEAWIALLTLIFLEVVLGVDNIIFISIVAGKLPKEKQPKARNLGLLLAMVFRLVLLLGISIILDLDKEPVFEIFGMKPTGKDLILAVGGLFLLAKSTSEIHQKMEGATKHESKTKSSFTKAVIQICFLNIVFSFDSILTAIGLTQFVVVMVISVIVSVIVMMIFAGKIANFISKHPALEMLALSFLILIGFMLLVEGIVFIDGEHVHVPKGYVYFAVFFSLIVELLNMRTRRKKQETVELHKKMD